MHASASRLQGLRAGWFRRPTRPKLRVRSTLLSALLGVAGLAACASSSPPVETAGVPELQHRPGTASRRVDTAVGRLAVYDSQASTDPATLPTLVLWPSVYADSGIYEPLVQRWRGRMRVVRIDGPGHGASGPGPDGGFTMRACADAVKAVMDNLGIAKAAVGGTSWGGLVAGEFALAYPQATNAVVMLNTPVFAEPGMGDRMIVLGTRVVGNTEFFARQVANGFFLESTLRARGPVVSGFFDHLAAKPRGPLADAVQAVLVEREALAPRLEGIRARTLFVTGRHDAMYPGDRLVQAARRIPKVNVVEVDARHIAVVDRPREVGDLIEAVVLGR